MELHELLMQYTRIASHIRQHIKDEIDKIPENEQVHRLGSNCFLVRFSEMARWNVLSAEFYDFAVQKRRLKEILGTAVSLERQVERLADVAETGKLKIAGKAGSGYTMVFHPKICQALKQILSDCSLEPTTET